MRAALAPLAIIQQQAVKVGATNSWRFLLRDQIWDVPGGVQEVTAALAAAQPER